MKSMEIILSTKVNIIDIGKFKFCDLAERILIKE